MVTLLVPIVALIGALSGSFVLLDYVNVITEGAWTGIDLFMGLLISRAMRSLDPPTRAEIIKRRSMMLFFMLALASATTTGVYIAIHTYLLSSLNRLFLIVVQ
ncbi:hypothetical protein L3N51_02194 [Metallosphaera sp. J1]|uniref:hypothetical protein n=1 Tax=Metallosphaera javensis (ex Hofmann et al. 2022) TaxID=99938 RepID=UPI001EDF1179|nr:hypothetical protein [Metallosphaera javensis (ex Hofmann et al. 2022)]MCG3109897.1 hypothetical protein [Metallosphaera javensis (ex Hofmann et al. 2022)]